MDFGKRIAELVQEACIREVCAPKPGNVNPHHDFSDTSFEDFLLGAIAVGAAFENAGDAAVGETVLRAVEDSRRRAGSNTNLGIILLLAPLTKACCTVAREQAGDVLKIRESLGAVLNALTVQDARLAYEAIRIADPAGLGRAPEQDISEEPSVTLLEAMELAKDRDSVASEYGTNFEITFGTGLPALKEALSRGLKYSDAVVQAFLAILGRVPDTLIARKGGRETSRRVSKSAQEVLLEGGVYTPEGRARLREMDRALRDGAHKLNPGATADLTAATVFLELVEREALRVHQLTAETGIAE
ncbi:MAG: triphosphoribosyl-dephospho-CoA synthase [Acidobacteria bacterium]|nr:triphosphoribosyl-dephospho-CoA synthase [Acidobacteriota bacterium]